MSSGSENGHAYSRWTATTQKELAWLFKVTPRMVRKWLNRGMPVVKDSKGNRTGYSVRDVIAWCRETVWLPPESDESLMAVESESPALERLRRARAEMAEIELLEKKNVLIHAESAHKSMTLAASIIRKAGETLQLEFGPEAHDILDSAIDDAERAIDDFFNSLAAEAHDDGDETERLAI